MAFSPGRHFRSFFLVRDALFGWRRVSFLSILKSAFREKFPLFLQKFSLIVPAAKREIVFVVAFYFSFRSFVFRSKHDFFSPLSSIIRSNSPNVAKIDAKTPNYFRAAASFASRRKKTPPRFPETAFASFGFAFRLLFNDFSPIALAASRERFRAKT